MILIYLHVSASSGLLKFDMKMFVNISRLDIGHCSLKAKGGASVYFGHISSSIYFAQLLQQNV